MQLLVVEPEPILHTGGLHASLPHIRQLHTLLKYRQADNRVSRKVRDSSKHLLCCMLDET